MKENERGDSAKAARTKQFMKYMADSPLSKEDRDQFTAFLAEKQAQNISAAGLTNYAYTLLLLSRYAPGRSIKTLTKADLIGFVNHISDKYRKSSMDNFKIAMKCYLKYVHKEQNKEIYSWLKVKRSQSEMIPEAVLNEQDVRKLIEACDNARDRVLIATLYESGARISEFLGMQMQHVQFNGVMAKVFLNGKTGKRIVPLLQCEPALREFIENHPDRNNQEAYLWTRKHGSRCAIGGGVLSLCRINRLLKYLAKKANLKKPIHCHSLRHARATELSKTMNEMALRQLFGWTKTSNMPAVYLHVSQKDIEDKMLEDSGIKPKEVQQSQVLLPKTCPKCKTKNVATRKFCVRCESCLDINTALEIDAQKNDLLDAFVRKIANDLRKDPQLIEHFLVSGDEITKIKS